MAGFHVAYVAAAGTMVVSAGLAWLLPRPQRAEAPSRAVAADAAG